MKTLHNQVTNMEQIKKTALGFLNDSKVELDTPQDEIINHPFSEHGYFNDTDPETKEKSYTYIGASAEVYQRFEEQTRAFIEETETPDSFFLYISKQFQSLFLKCISPYLSAQDLGTCLNAVWTCANLGFLNKSDMVQLFQMSDPKTLMSDSERKFLEQLPDTVEIYRGVTKRGERIARGMSWTVDLDRARWFAGRCETKGYVYKAAILKSDILAYFDGRQEAEIVVNTRKLVGVELLEEVEPKTVVEKAG